MIAEGIKGPLDTLKRNECDTWDQHPILPSCAKLWVLVGSVTKQLENQISHRLQTINEDSLVNYTVKRISFLSFIEYLRITCCMTI